MAGHSHRSSFKNGHKGFKSRHSSKGAIKRLNKGKVEKDAKGGKPAKGVSKLQRKNVARQKREHKILDTLEIRKLFEGPRGAQKIITVIPLCSDIDPEEIIHRLIEAADENLESSNRIRDFYVKKFKSHLKFIIPDMTNFIQILDCAKVSDFCVFGLSGTSEVDPQFGEQVLRALELQGIGSQLGVVTNLSQVHPKEKFQLDIKQSLESYFKHFFPNQEKVFNLEKNTESLNAIRTLCQRFPQGISWRDQRGYMVANRLDFIQRDEQFGELVIEGIVRGAGFNANRLVHVPEFGDFQVSKIERLRNSERNNKLKNPNINNSEEGLDFELNNVFESNENRDGLESYAPQEAELQDEEDFPYEELESARYDDHGFLPGREQGPTKAKFLPRGTSDYQARWYLDDVLDVGEDEEIDERVSEDELDEGMDQDEIEEGDGEVPQPSEQIVDEEGAEDDDYMDLDPEQEEQQLQEFRAKEKEDLEFPDEIELHPNESAIESLKKYRGVKNLGNCNWDVDERDPDMPDVWKRLLRIPNYKNTRNRVTKENRTEIEVIEGDVVQICIKFPNDQLTKIQDPSQNLFALYGLLPHEHKNAVVNFTMQRWEDYDKPVPSETPLVVQYGMRRYTIQPLFSAASNTSNNVHKFDRFLQPDSLSVATCIAPVDFTQCPAIFFKPTLHDPKGLELVAQGSFFNTDYTRIIASRVILTGHPFRFHRSFVTVRYMFFSPEDVEWFKSIPLFTKSGRSGFIKESLGTHGYFKASFDGKLSAEDVVAMSLYKREWPRTSQLWTTTYQ